MHKNSYYFDPFLNLFISPNLSLKNKIVKVAKKEAKGTILHPSIEDLKIPVDKESEKRMCDVAINPLDQKLVKFQCLVDKF